MYYSTSGAVARSIRLVVMAAPSGPDPAVMEAIERGNAVVSFDVGMGYDVENAAPLGRIKLELFVHDVSRCHNCCTSMPYT